MRCVGAWGGSFCSALYLVYFWEFAHVSKSTAFLRNCTFVLVRKLPGVGDACLTWDLRGYCGVKSGGTRRFTRAPTRGVPTGDGGIGHTRGAPVGDVARCVLGAAGRCVFCAGPHSKRATMWGMHGSQRVDKVILPHTRCGGGCRRGGVAGAEPPHKGGPNRPDRPEMQ